MAYKISFKSSVWKDINSIDRKDAKRILKHIETNLSENPDSYPSLTGKFAGLRKYRIGDYRIIFSILGDTVLVLRVRHRREVYK